jgi:hypothetical protein
LPLDRQVNSRELLLLIDNRDNPPLQITAVDGKRRPVYATFFCQNTGAYSLLVGNPQASAPRYDLASLSSSLREAPVSSVAVTALAVNPSYQPTETLPEIQDLGTKLDLSEWKFRKLVRIKEGVIKPDLIWKPWPGLILIYATSVSCGTENSSLIFWNALPSPTSSSQRFSRPRIPKSRASVVGISNCLIGGSPLLP